MAARTALGQYSHFGGFVAYCRKFSIREGCLDSMDARFGRARLGVVLALASFAAQAGWPVLPAGEVVCDNWSAALEQAHYFMQGIDDLADKKACGHLKADTEYAVIGSAFIRDENGKALKGIPMIRVRKNNMKAYYIPRDEK